MQHNHMPQLTHSLALALSQHTCLPACPPACSPACRFPSTELYKGSGALVQMQSVEQAAVAIQTLNGSFPRGATQPLLVRYADSPGAQPASPACRCPVLALPVSGGGKQSKTGNSGGTWCVLWSCHAWVGGILLFKSCWGLQAQTRGRERDGALVPLTRCILRQGLLVLAAENSTMPVS